MPSARSRSVVGQKQTEAPPRAVMSAAVRWVAWTAVNRPPTRPAPARTSTGVRPYAAMQSSFSAGCSLTWACSGAPRSSAHPPTIAISSGATARTEWTAAPALTVGDEPTVDARAAHRSASPSEKRCCTSLGGRPIPPWR